ncbi:MAG: class I tRNA ligase family protein, partial [Candidatus Shapirobacteria bacterium]|nr:class I tRNA ligase family protein [Candidatus Shapirobacteria bacterium]
VADKYGVDVVRMYLMFMGPFDSTMAWNEKTLMGVKRFLDRFDKFTTAFYRDNQTNEITADRKDVLLIINKLIKGVTEDLSSFKYNTAIAKLMEALNSLSTYKLAIKRDEILILAKLIAPLAPYLAEEVWSHIRSENDAVSVHLSDWPKADEKYLVEDEVSLPVAINGKVRGQLTVKSDELVVSNKEKIIAKAKELEQVKKWIGEGKIVKEIYVPGKMVNLVVQ